MSVSNGINHLRAGSVELKWLHVHDEQIFKFHYLPSLHEPVQDVLPFEFASQARWRATWK